MNWYFLIAILLLCGAAVAIVARPLVGTSNRGTVTAVAISLPIFSLSVYFFLGSPAHDKAHAALPPTSALTSNTMTASTQQKVGSVANMLIGLESRLQKNPNDGKGWLLLARSYEHLGRIDQSISAYEKAADLGEYDPNLAALADNKPLQHATAPRSATISGTLLLSDRVAGIVQSTDTVFIFARASGASGIPAAVLRRPAATFPIHFKLDDALSMVEGVKLSDFEEVVITARISRSGNAAEALQNLQVKSEPVTVADNAQIRLTIE